MDHTGTEPAAANRPLLIAIDGPAGAGKSTVAREVARRLRLGYLDTGSMYRAVTLSALGRRIDLADTDALGRLADQLDLAVGTDPAAPWVRVDGQDVTAALRQPAVNAAVSQVSAAPQVRAALVRQQRQLIAGGNFVVEGRDIGTVVAPDARVKVFLTATPRVRALRRLQESQPEGPVTSAELTAAGAAIGRRDRLDSARPVAPLTKAADATRIDTSRLQVPEVVDAVLAACRNTAPVVSHPGNSP